MSLQERMCVRRPFVMFMAFLRDAYLELGKMLLLDKLPFSMETWVEKELPVR